MRMAPTSLDFTDAVQSKPYVLCARYEIAEATNDGFLFIGTDFDFDGDSTVIIREKVDAIGLLT